jgi:glycerol-3-phosphate acyltransferase PlsY
MEQHIHLVIVSVLLIILPFIAARNVLVPVMVISAFLIIILPLYCSINAWVLIICFVLLAGLIFSIGMAQKRRLFRLERNVELKKWRIVARPLALLFIPIEIYLGHIFLLYLLGGLSIVFILTDLYRIIFRQKLLMFFKKTEAQRFSSMTSFLVAIFIVFLVFPVNVSYLCLAFITFGDMAGKLIGLKYGRKKLIRTRTLAGSLGFLTGCLFSGYILLLLLDIRFSLLFVGAVCATLSELFSFSLDDNFTVSILTGACLVALQYFQVI